MIRSKVRLEKTAITLIADTEMMTGPLFIDWYIHFVVFWIVRFPVTLESGVTVVKFTSGVMLTCSEKKVNDAILTCSEKKST